MRLDDDGEEPSAVNAGEGLTLTEASFAALPIIASIEKSVAGLVCVVDGDVDGLEDVDFPDPTLCDEFSAVR